MKKKGNVEFINVGEDLSNKRNDRRSTSDTQQTEGWRRNPAGKGKK